MRKLAVSSAQILLLSLLIVTFAISAAAQNNKGAIVGTVKDPNDALVSKAQVKVTNAKTGEVRTTDTSDEGTFTVTNLEPGPYNITVEGTGFQAVTFEAVQVETNSRLPLDVKFSTITSSNAILTVKRAPLQLVPVTNLWRYNQEGFELPDLGEIQNPGVVFLESKWSIVDKIELMNSKVVFFGQKTD